MAEKFESKAADLVKKVLTAGIGAIFLTEESLRTLVSEFKLPKELLAGMLDSANKTKNEFLSKLSSDVMDRLAEKVDPKALMSELLDKRDIEFNVKISFKPKSDG